MSGIVSIMGSLSSMGGMVGNLSSAFSGLGSIFSSAVGVVRDLWQGLVEWVTEKWEGIKAFYTDHIEPIFTTIGEMWDAAVGAVQGALEGLNLPPFWTWDYWFGDDGILSTIMGWLPDWDSMFSFEISEILTWDYWFGEEGVFMKLFNWAFDWDRLWAFTLPLQLSWDFWFGESGIFSNLFDFGINWDDLWSFDLPEQLSWDYWFGEEGIFSTLISFIDWDELFSLPTLDEVLTWDYWFGRDGVFNFARYLVWDDIFGIELPEWVNLDWWVDLFGSIVEGIMNKFKEFGAFIKNLLTAPINFLIGKINAFFDSIDFSVEIWNPLGDNWEVGVDLSGWDIPMLAKGGVVTGPTLAMIGEAGPEAVIPLDRAGGMGGMGQTFNITINAGGLPDRTDKRQFARDIGSEIQREVARVMGGGVMRAGR